MDKNFDVDEHIEKIKKQMGQDVQNSDIADVAQEILDGVPSNEPSLDNYGEQETQSENITDIAQEENSLENQNDGEQAQEEQNSEQTQENEIDNEWQDPFGTSENDAVKKYVIYIAKDFVPLFDHMNKDARSAFVNDALELKIQSEGKDRKWHSFVRILRHIIVSVFTLLIAVPALFWLADKSITATVQNYEYVQKNFEKLYKEKADRDRAAKEIQQMRLGL